MSLPLRAYVLKCRNGKHYVGISPAHKIQTRVQGHFSEEAMDASHFCAKNPPISVLCVWPVRHEAAEAYLFFVMMQALKCTDFRNLGGFVFTSSKPSPLVVMQLEQSRRQLEDRCFTCGGGHHAKNQKCPGPNSECYYKCNSCKSVLNISSRGGTQVYATAAEAIAASAGSTLAAAATSAALSVAASSSVALTPPRHPSARVAARSPTMPTKAARGLKRSAGQAFQRDKSALSFDECWNRCRKQGRYGCVKDVLGDMDTVQAGKSYKHIDENLPRWSKRFHWGASQCKQKISAFFGHQGGASRGAGCTAEAMADVYKHHNR